MLCTLFTLIIHVHDINHCPSWTILQKLVIPLKQKENKCASCSWILVRAKKRERGRIISAKALMMDKCRCLHMHMIKVLEWHGYLETHCLNLQNKWKRWACTSVTIYTRERLRLKRIIQHECPSELNIQDFAFVFKIWKPSKLQEERPALILGDKFWGSIDESDDVSHLESKVCKES